MFFELKKKSFEIENINSREVLVVAPGC